MLVSMLIFAVVLPVISIKKYYSPSQYGLFRNLFGIVVGLITWPYIPIRLAWRAGDKWMITWYWVSFVVFVVSFGYWIIDNVENVVQMLAAQQQL